MNNLAIFESWLAERDKEERAPLSSEGAKLYGYVWQSWCRWLEVAHGADAATLAGASFLTATPQDVQTFLAAKHAKLASKTPISEVTRRRYWRLLERVYQRAKDLHMIETNPVIALTGDDRPEPESSVGVVLARPYFEALYKGLPTGQSMWDLRDRAILLLFLEAALTPGEVCGLRLDQVSSDQRLPSRLRLQISGLRHWQSREMVLSDLASIALAAWLKVRRRMEIPTAAVFLTQQDEVMSGRPLHHLVGKAVTASAVAAMMPVPMHIGPQVLRNTRIVLWINDGMEPSEVVKLAGYKDARSFRGLRPHFAVRVVVPKSGFRHTHL